MGGSKSKPSKPSKPRQLSKDEQFQQSRNYWQKAARDLFELEHKLHQGPLSKDEWSRLKLLRPRFNILMLQEVHLRELLGPRKETPPQPPPQPHPNDTLEVGYLDFKTIADDLFINMNRTPQVDAFVQAVVNDRINLTKVLAKVLSGAIDHLECCEYWFHGCWECSCSKSLLYDHAQLVNPDKMTMPYIDDRTYVSVKDALIRAYFNLGQISYDWIDKCSNVKEMEAWIKKHPGCYLTWTAVHTMSMRDHVV